MSVDDSESLLASHRPRSAPPPCAVKAPAPAPPAAASRGLGCTSGGCPYVRAHSCRRWKSGIARVGNETWIAHGRIEPCLLRAQHQYQLPWRDRYFLPRWNGSASGRESANVRRWTWTWTWHESGSETWSRHDHEEHGSGSESRWLDEKRQDHPERTRRRVSSRACQGLCR